MKPILALAGLLAAVPTFASPITKALAVVDQPAEPIVLEKRASLDYTQNYNGGAASFQSNLQAGTFSARWGGNTDFVVGLGWRTGSAR